MPAYLALPLVFLQFWFIEAPLSLLRYFASFNSAFLQLFSFHVLVRTFFKPLKNEYRQGLVGFSIGMGIAVKSCLLFVDVLLLLLLFVIEFIVLAAFLLVPILAIVLLLPTL